MPFSIPLRGTKLRLMLLLARGLPREASKGAVEASSWSRRALIWAEIRPRPQQSPCHHPAGVRAWPTEQTSCPPGLGSYRLLNIPCFKPSPILRRVPPQSLLALRRTPVSSRKPLSSHIFTQDGACLRPGSRSAPCGLIAARGSFRR